MRRLFPVWRYTPYLVVSLLALGPLLAPGFVLSMDMVFTPTIHLPDHVDNTYLFYALLHVLDVVLPADLLQKVMLLAILLLSGIGMHRLFTALDSQARDRHLAVYVGGLFYMVNPFVYDRLMAGQYGVLLGYALLPWFVRSLLAFVQRPGWATTVSLAAWAVAVSVASIHAVGMMLVLGLVAVLIYSRKRLRRVALYGAAGVGLWLIASSYWLVPTLIGQGRIAESIATFDTAGRAAFATVDANGAGPLGSVLGLQGFWQETRGLFVLPIDALYGWGIVQLVVWILVVGGLAVLWRRQRRAAVFMIASAAIAAALAVGWGSDMLSAHLPFFAGYREPQKFAAIVALVFALAVSYAVAWLMGRSRRQWVPWMILGLSALLVAAYTPTMWWGAYGQLRAVDYPAEWYRANEMLNRDTTTGRVLVLPWHLYMSYDFAGRIIANPSSAFFDRPVIISDDPELPGVQPQTQNVLRSEVQDTVLPSLRAEQPVGARLGQLQISHVLIAKELDWRAFHLDKQPDLQLIYDSPSLRLYRLTHGTIKQHENN